MNYEYYQNIGDVKGWNSHKTNVYSIYGVWVSKLRGIAVPSGEFNQYFNNTILTFSFGAFCNYYTVPVPPDHYGAQAAKGVLPFDWQKYQDLTSLMDFEVEPGTIPEPPEFNEQTFTQELLIMKETMEPKKVFRHSKRIVHGVEAFLDGFTTSSITKVALIKGMKSMSDYNKDLTEHYNDLLIKYEKEFKKTSNLIEIGDVAKSLNKYLKSSGQDITLAVPNSKTQLLSDISNLLFRLRREDRNDELAS